MASFGKFRYSRDGVNWSPRDVAAVPDTLPTVPRTVTATANSYSQITVAWTAPSTVGGLSAYQVRYKAGSAPTGPTDGTFLTNTTSLSYVHAGLSSSTAYGYYVFGITGDGQNGPGATATATTPVGIPSAPLNVRTTAAAYNSLTIAWDAPSSPGGLTGYHVRYDANRIPTHGSDATFVTNTTGLSASAGTNESTYYGFYVAGYIADGTQGPGGTTSWTTPARPTSGGSIYPPAVGSGYWYTQSTAKTLTGPNWGMPVNGYITGFNLRLTGSGTTGSCNPHIGGNYLGWRDVGLTTAGSPGWSDHGTPNWYFGAGTYSSGCNTGGQSPKVSQWSPYSGGGSSNVAVGQLNYWYYTASWVTKEGEHIDTHTDSWCGPDGAIIYERVYEMQTRVLVAEKGVCPSWLAPYEGERMPGVTWHEEA